MKTILGEAKTIRGLLSNCKYAVDYYQREYKWESKQIQELLNDLTGKFLEDHEATHERSAVEKYGHYFLGSIIISHHNSQKFVIDGQQRLTSLTLLLVYLNNLQKGSATPVKIDELIYSEKFGKKSFNIDVDERAACMETLFDGRDSFDEAAQTESVKRIIAHYEYIEEHFVDDLREKSLPFFIDWLIDKVHLVEITASSDEDAYTIFETMNDRGLSLTPTEMLKGFLLAKIEDPDQRNAANQLWKDRVQTLTTTAKESDADCLKAWLRSQYAKAIRAHKRDATPEDFDRIGSEFHRWIRENVEQLRLNSSADFIQFIQRDFNYFARQYLRIAEASRMLMTRLEEIYYNANLGFTLQHPLLLAPLSPDDKQEIADKKMRMMAIFLDILLFRRLWNSRHINYNTMQHYAFLVIKDVRHKSPSELCNLLLKKLDENKETFSSNDHFSLHGMNRKQIKSILARITDYIETQSGFASHYVEYSTGTGTNKYEVEHVWADKPERHTGEFTDKHEFYKHRNRLGGLLLLPKSFNASYGALPYDEKVPHYFSQNLLARSLNINCYEHNPGFTSFIKRSGLAFQAHKTFCKADIDARQLLYRQLAEAVWNPNRLTDCLAADV